MMNMKGAAMEPEASLKIMRLNKRLSKSKRKKNNEKRSRCI